MLERQKIEGFLSKVLTVLILIPNFVWADPKFKIIQETYRGKVFDVHVPEAKGDLDLTTTFPDEVLLGLESGHFYLLIGKKRIEGKFLPFPTMVHERNANKPSIFIRFPTLDKVKAAAAEAKLSKEFPLGGFSISCVNQACTSLRDRLNIRVNKSDSPVFLTTTFKHILEDGFVDENGKPIPFEIYKINSDEASLSKRSKGFALSDVSYSLLSIGATYYVLKTALAMSGDALAYVKPRCKSAFSRMSESLKTHYKAAPRIELSLDDSGLKNEE